MRIRKTTLNDLEPVMAMYDYARKFMQEHGNPNQWINGYPSEEYIRREIADGHSYICENEQGEMVGTFCFIVGEDPTYAVIDNGKWLNDAPYGVIHRMASNGKEKGIADQCRDLFHHANALTATYYTFALLKHLDLPFLCPLQKIENTISVYYQ